MLLSTGSLPAEENWVGFDVRGPAAFADYAGIVATPQVWDMSALFRLREQPPDSSAPYAVSHFGFWADLGDPWFSSAAPGAVFGELRMVFTTASVTAAELLGAYNADPDNPILQLQFVPTPGITPQQSFLLPIARTDANHQFALAQRDANGTVVNYSMTLGNQLADGVGNWLPYRHGHAIYDPARAFWVVDLTARERTPDNATHLGLAPWTPDYSLYPLVAVTLYLEGREAGHHFTVHSQAGSGPIVTALVVASSPLGAGWVYDPAGNYIEVPAGCASHAV